jgi:hypothetical protein
MLPLPLSTGITAAGCLPQLRQAVKQREWSTQRPLLAELLCRTKQAVDDSVLAAAGCNRGWGVRHPGPEVAAASPCLCQASLYRLLKVLGVINHPHIQRTGGALGDLLACSKQGSSW